MKGAGDFEHTLCNHSMHLKCINFSNLKYFLKQLQSDCKLKGLSIDILNEAINELQVKNFTDILSITSFFKLTQSTMSFIIITEIYLL